MQTCTPQLIFDQWIDKYMHLMKNYKFLLLPSHLLFQLYCPIIHLSTCLEDTISTLFELESFSNTLPPLDSLLQTNSSKPQFVDAIRLLVNDCILFSSLHPFSFETLSEKLHSLYEYTFLISRFSIRPLTPNLTAAIFKEIYSLIKSDQTIVDTLDFSKSIYFSHLSPLSNFYSSSVFFKNSKTWDREEVQDDCIRENVFQCMLLLSLVQFSTVFRNKLLEDSLFCAIYKSPFLYYWLLNCSNTDEQYFLNTCDVTATANSIIAFHPFVASLYLLSDFIFEFVQSRIQLLTDFEPAYPSLWGSVFVPSVKSYAQIQLAKFQSLTTQLRIQTEGLLISERLQPLSINLTSHVTKIRSLVKKWSYSIQVISSIFKPEAPIVLTKKIFSQKWHLSAKLSSLFSLVFQVLPGVPTFLSRAQGSYQLECVPYALFHYQLPVLDPSADDYIYLYLSQHMLSAKDNASEQKRLLILLWRRLVFYGGLLFSTREHLLGGIWTIGHLSYCMAVKLNNEADEDQG
ncbi:uncharacterized protein LOC126320488 isoform X2 [Schistocerca gregaria]|nr:uncharacterized protein LOC126320488 isoform X2 [Schistocerca gregaria]